MCLLNCHAWPNDFLHSEQVWVFTPLWVSRCLFKVPARPNDLLHWTHLYDLSSVWITMCLFRAPARPNDFWHSAHLCLLSPLERREWLAISLCFSIENSARRCLLNWTIWNFPVPMQRLVLLLLFNVYGELDREVVVDFFKNHNQFFVCDSQCVCKAR